VTSDRRRALPRTDAVLADPRLVGAASRLGRPLVKAAVVSALDTARRGGIDADAVADVAVASLPRAAASLRPVVNATGVVVHTNLGRAPLSAAAVDAMVAAAGYVDIEYDVATGSRARRGQGALDALRGAVPEAGDVHVVNNGAAALALAAAALAATGADTDTDTDEIVVSRGELVEIGDGFRLPDLLGSTGARLVEVGTTNRTTLRDYAEAVGPRTALILKVHPSNFVVTGFTAAVDVAALATVGPPVVVDIGSGLLAPEPSLPDEPDASTALRGGAALVTASADKLLGGPQAGLVLGRADLVERLRRHPLARAMRVDKLTLAALEATVRGPRPPVGEFIAADPATLRARADAIAASLAAAGIDAAVVASDGVVGGGGAPGLTLPGWAVALPTRYADALRQGDPCVVARVERGRCLLDLRCVPAGLDATMTAAVVAV
jgi:L-seryl-tRNA(Ser) seleniumtransferase